MSKQIDKLAKAITLSRIKSYDDFLKMRENLSANDFQLAADVLSEGLIDLDDEKINTLAQVISFFTRGNLIVMEQQNLKDVAVKGGIMPKVDLRWKLKELIQNEDAFKKAINYAVTSDEKFAELYYATYIIEIWPGAVLPNSQNGIDLYIFDFKEKADGSIVYLDENKQEIPDNELKTYVEHLLHNHNPATKTKLGKEIGVLKILEIKSKKTSGKINNIADNDFEFGKEQILKIIAGEFDEKNGLALVLYNALDTSEFALFVEESHKAKNYAKLQAVAKAEARINAFLWKLQEQEIKADILKFETVETKKSWITSNRATYQVPLWKLSTRGWHFKGFDDAWITNAAGPEATSLIRIFSREFKTDARVLSQRFLHYAYDFVADKYDKARIALIKIGTKDDPSKIEWKISDENHLESVVRLFNELMDDWINAVTQLSTDLFGEDLVRSIDNIEQNLHLSGHRKYTSQSMSPETAKSNEFNNNLELNLLEILKSKTNKIPAVKYTSELDKFTRRGIYTVTAKSELPSDLKIVKSIDPTTNKMSAEIVAKKTREKKSVLK